MATVNSNSNLISYYYMKVGSMNLPLKRSWSATVIVIIVTLISSFVFRVVLYYCYCDWYSGTHDLWTGSRWQVVPWGLLDLGNHFSQLHSGRNVFPKKDDIDPSGVDSSTLVTSDSSDSSD